MRLIDRVSTDFLRDRVDVVVKIEDMIIKNHLWYYSNAIHRDIKSQIHEATEPEINGKKKKVRPRK